MKTASGIVCNFIPYFRRSELPFFIKIFKILQVISVVNSDKEKLAIHYSTNMMKIKGLFVVR